ncbi:hypothetical protein F442_19375 [Phytophthora nicotianae P10297]|uniref:Uncharacterized protein n=1 Tax=Phytophthora nicotianae P10297 TaxID=1317064 RepID=W2Y9Q7_PHYNI|nr:hypothetical protein F442_19375 [Phytophthora nicotianae P10297]
MCLSVVARVLIGIRTSVGLAGQYLARILTDIILRSDLHGCIETRFAGLSLAGAQTRAATRVRRDDTDIIPRRTVGIHRDFGHCNMKQEVSINIRWAHPDGTAYK